ncbi:MAG: VCBS repeat-containing protein [Caldilineaceae bacterium]|nr:VCBS repeat-containing protein [Caldilineaceae bacterium]HRJ42077.1 CRTAC1 family protein [Caldilineaceae bacterium]
MQQLRHCFLLLGYTLFLLLLAACAAQRDVPETQPAPASAVPIRATTTQLNPRQPCTGRFVSHRLPFATGTRLREIRTYESNGAGLSANDLDGDGDLDLLFASIDRNSAILWNEGGLAFRAQEVADPFTRSAQIVDVDGDGLLDLLFSRRGLGGVGYWQNRGDSAAERFVATPLPGVESYAYALAWADLGGDSRLDLVVGSYNTDLKQNGIATPETDDRAGLFYYQAGAEGYTATRLSSAAEALSIGLTDVDGDLRPDIWVANDFGLTDSLWRWEDSQKGWQSIAPFSQISHSTMSTEWGDIGNDGELAFFSTDMNPYDTSPGTLARWLPMMNATEEPHLAGDPQRMANVLQVRAAGGWRNLAAYRGVEATGWSWAARFGDLDNDGLLDLYVVNGMIAENLFGHLDNGELVEENQALRNLGQGNFTPAPEWGLGATASGRGMVLADMDGDGDLDAVINNLRSSALLLENRLCAGPGLEVDLRWPDSANPFAVGALVELVTSQGVLRRDVRASGGYLSGDPLRLHFGFHAKSELQALRIRWPDGALSVINELLPDTRLEVTR